MGHCDVCSDVCQGGIAYYIPLISNGFMDSLTRLVYLIMVSDGLFVSIIHCHFLYFEAIFILFKLLTHIHMVSLITVLNGIVEQFVIFSIIINFWLIHSICFCDLMSHLILLSVVCSDLFGLFSYCTK